MTSDTGAILPSQTSGLVVNVMGRQQSSQRFNSPAAMARLAAVLCLALVIVLVALSHAAPQAAGANGPLVGGNPCSWGPSYWCNSHQNANKCNVMDWCVEKKMLTRQ